VSAEGGDRRDRSPAGIARVARRSPESLRFIHDEKIDSRSHGLIGQLRSIDQHVDGDHHTTMHVEGVEVGTEIARDVGEALRIEQCEHLVVFAPELTEPLHGQRLRHDDEAAIDLPGVHQPIQDQRGLDCFSKADFVGEQPTYGNAGARALSDMQLMREESDASAQKGAQAIGFAERPEVEDVQADDEIFEVIEIVQFANARQAAGLSRLDALRDAALTRLRPVLMTSAAMVLGQLPLVLVSGPGAAARNSIGIILVAGMIIGTLFTLFVVPVFYSLLAADHHLKPEPAGEVALAHSQ